MMQRIGIGEFLGCLIDHIEQATGTRCYDSPRDKASPLYSVELVSTEDKQTKTMFLDVFNVNVHCVSEEVRPYSNAPVLRLVQALQEALTDDIELPEPFFLNSQTCNGLRSIKEDASGEGHAVLSYSFQVCYAFRCK